MKNGEMSILNERTEAHLAEPDNRIFRHTVTPPRGVQTNLFGKKAQIGCEEMRNTRRVFV